MEKLKITEGEVTSYIPTTKDGEKLFFDAYNTYNKCGKLPSELMEENERLETANANLDWNVSSLLEENRELVEALKLMYSRFEHSDKGYIKADYARIITKALLTKIENKE